MLNFFGQDFIYVLSRTFIETPLFASFFLASLLVQHITGNFSVSGPLLGTRTREMNKTETDM